MTAPPLGEPLSRDPDDDHVIAAAVAARADLIVSGDRDLLDLERFRNTPIVTATKAVTMINATA